MTTPSGWSDAEVAQLPGGADPREEEQLRRIKDTRADDHLAAGRHLAGGCLNARRAPFLVQQDAKCLHLRPDVEILREPRERVQVRDGARPSQLALRIHGHPASAFPAAVGIPGVLGVAGLLARLDEGRGGVVVRRVVLEPGPLEDAIVVAPGPLGPPPGRPAGLPGAEVVVRGPPGLANVVGATATENPCAAVADVAVAALLGLHGVVVVVFRLQKLGPAWELEDLALALVRRARFEQADAHVGVLSEPRREHRSGRPAAHDHVVEFVCHASVLLHSNPGDPTTPLVAFMQLASPGRERKNRGVART
jgi:hypothetical protein